MEENVKEVCMIPNCIELIHSRGLCVNCYMTAYRLIRSGQTTWKKLEEAGKVKKGPKNKKAQGWFLAEQEK